MRDIGDSDRAIKLIKVLEDPYEFIALLGRGGSGLVFEVENRRLGRREALKFLSHNLGRDGSQRFIHEAKIMAGLDHPHIMPIYAFGEDEGCLWYSMKLVEGPTLAGFLKTMGPLSADQALRVAVPVLEALALAHDRGVVHRDIKPGNILLDPQAGALVTDFGVAKIEGDPLQTETGVMLGTPAYVSPEQSLGKKVDGRTDLYALGVSLYEGLTGRLPFQEGNSLAMVLQRLQEEAPSLGRLRPDVPAALSAAIMRAMDRDVERRFSSAQEMRDALLQAAGGSVDWQSPLRLPEQAGPRREPLPEDLLLAMGYGDPGDVTAAARVRLDPSAPTPPPMRRLAVSTILLRIAVGLAVVVFVLQGWRMLRRGSLPRPSSDVGHPQPAPRQPEVPIPAAVPATDRSTTRPRNQALDPVPIRRAVVPPQLLEAPKVPRSEGSSCLGQSVTVEVQVDEQGLVTAARLLSKVPAECANPALQAARACHFAPAKAADGLPVPSTLAIAIEL